MKNMIKRTKIHNWLTIGLYLFSMTCMNTGCIKKVQQNSEEQKAKEAASFTTSDTPWEENKTSIGCKLYADYPTNGSPFLVQNIREWISESMGGDYNGDLADGKKVLEHYGKAYSARMKKDMEEFGENQSMGQSVYYIQFRNAFETGQFVTYTQEIYQYTSGAAHGGESFDGVVFRKSDGRRMGWNVFKKDSIEAIRTFIASGIQHLYFKEKDEKAFREKLLIDEYDDFPLPQTDPLFMKDGVQFVYQQYEIAPYASGRPSCTIPYEILKNYFTATALPLAESYNDSIATRKKPIQLWP